MPTDRIQKLEAQRLATRTRADFGRLFKRTSRRRLPTASVLVTGDGDEFKRRDPNGRASRSFVAADERFVSETLECHCRCEL